MSRSPIEHTPRTDVAGVVLPVVRGEEHAHERLQESEGLVRALGVELAFCERTNIRDVHPGRFFGSGQLEHIGARLSDAKATLLVVDGPLSPIQQRNLETDLQIKVLDRTGLILEIFGLRARTAEGRLQVEMARSLYERSRLVRTWTHLERQKGGFGFLGGPGETQLEADRRLLDKRLATIRRDLEDVRRTRRLQRRRRSRQETPVVALVGYTNAGKSTLFNRLARADVLAADMPFATLDPTTRTVAIAQGRAILLIDTVGFISDLPTALVAAFRATLEEVIEADLLLHVRDISHVDTDRQAEDVETVLDQIEEGADADLPPVIEVWNKADRLDLSVRAVLQARAELLNPPAHLVSAITGEGVGDVLGAVDAALFHGRELTEVRLPLPSGRARAWLHETCDVVSEHPVDDQFMVVLARMTGDERDHLLSIEPRAELADAASQSGRQSA